MDERAYKIRRTGNNSSLEVIIQASEESPLVNPAIVVENWGTGPASVDLDGKKLKPGKDYHAGYDTRLEGTDLIIWMNLDCSKSINLAIKY